MRAVLYMASAATAIAATTVAAQAMAQPRQFNIPAQPMQSALQSFGLQAEQQVTFRSADVRGQRSNTLVGTFEPEDGLRRLIGSGSSLSISKTSSGVFVVQRTAQPRQVRASALAATAQPVEAPGQAPEAAAESFGLEEIVVTAQKRTESLQDVPLSINALQAVELEARGISGVNDLLSGSIPSLRITPFGSRTTALNITMRGINPGDATQISRDGAVGIYIDGIYLGRVHGLGMELLDLERIEVLRGPQGTLFGRNALGGAISMISKRPTGEFSLDQTVGVRNYDGFDAVTHLNLPEFAGISIKLDGVWKERGGLVDNPQPGAWDSSQYKRWGVRASALWEPSDNVSFLYSYDRSKDRSTPLYPHLKALAADAPPLAPMFSLDKGRVKVARIGVPLRPSVGKVQGHSLNAEWQIADNATVKSLTGYRKMSQTQDDNFFGVFFAFRPGGTFGRRSFAVVDQDQFSQELQLVGDMARLKYVVGAFYFKENAKEGSGSTSSNQFNADGTGYTVLPEPVTWPLRDRASVNHSKSLAFYGQATWTPPVIDDRLHLTGGLRHTEDDKHGRLTYVGNQPVDLAYRFSSENTNYLVAVAFDWTPDVNTYVRWSTGYRAGGANSRSPTYRSFNPENVSNWELGLKSEFWSRRARFNATVFQMDYKDIQFGFYDGASQTTEVANARETIKIRGIEADLTLAPARGLTLTASYSYLDTEPLELTNPYTNLLVSQPVLSAPTHAGSAAVDYKFDAFGRKVLAHIDGIYSSAYFTNSQDPAKGSSHVLVNGRLTVEDLIPIGAGSLSVSLWGKNIFDKTYAMAETQLSGRGLAGIMNAVYNEPATYGIEARIRF